VLRDRWPLTPSAQRLVDNQMFGGRLSQRGGVRVHRLAWTVADLAGVEQPGEAEAEVALRLRSGDPLLVSTLQRRAG
jgi:magnesium chelatase family protein